MALINIQYTADISQLSARLDEIINKQNQLISSSNNAGQAMSNAAKSASNEVGVLGNSLQRLGGIVAAAFSIQRVVEFGKSVFDAERRIELLQNRLNFLTGSADKGSEAFLRMATISNKLGLDLETMLQGFADFGIAATQAGISVQKAEKIFVSVASGLRAAGASSLQTQRAFYALQQMMSKGVVAAEELRRQLGEALPGANELMVKAYNRLHPAQELTNRQFMKMQEEGKIISREILPEFAKVIEETFAPALAGKANSLDAAVNKVTSAWLQFKIAVGDLEAFKSATNSVGGLLNTMNIALTDESLSRLERFMIITSAPRLSSMSEEELANSVMGIEKVFKLALDRQKQRAELSVSTAQAEEVAVDALAASYEKLSNSLREAEMKRAVTEIENNRNIIKSQEPIIKNAEDQLKSKQSLVDALLRERKAYLPISEAERESLARAVKERDIAKSNLQIEKEKEKQASNTISVLQGAIKQYGLLDQARAEAADSVKKIENEGLRNFIAIQKIKLANAVKGSQDELAILQVLLVAEAQLRAENTKLTQKERLAIMEQAFRDAENLTKRFNDDTFKQYQVAIKSGEKFAKDLRKTLREQLYGTISDPMQLEIEKTIDHYNDLIEEAKKLGLDTVALEKAKYDSIDIIRKKSSDKEAAIRREMFQDQVREVQVITNAFSEFFSSRLELEAETAQSALKNLEQRFNKGLISEKQYEEQKLKLQKEAFEREKSLQIARAIMSGANAILSIIGNPTTAALAPVLIPLALGTMATQLSIIESQTPGFKEGVIGLNGPGTETSDSILARLSKGESVMTAAETRKHKDVLEAIRHDRLPSLIAEKYIIPAYKDSMDKPRKAASDATSMEAAFQTAELVQAIKGNKKIKIANVDEFSRAINSKSTSEYMARRRKW
jgi:tape measure domain-containing protein